MTTATTDLKDLPAGYEDDLPDIRWIPLDQIASDIPNHRHAARHDDAKIRRLADSMKEHGLRQPILVVERAGVNPKGGKSDPAPYTIVYGHRRLMAARLLEWHNIKAEVKAPMPVEQILEIRAIENLHRDDLNIMEQVIAVEELAEHHHRDVSKISAAIGQTESWVRDRLYLTRCCDQVRELALHDLLLVGHLRELCKIGDPLDQLGAALQALNHYGFYRSNGIKQMSKSVDELIKQSDSGKGEIRRVSVDDLRTLVEQKRQSLRTVPWELDQAFADCPACIGCRHNTTTDQTLFGPADGKNDKGFCLRRECYEAKTKVAEKEKQRAAKALVKQKTAGIAAARDVAKPFMKPASVSRAAQKELKAKGATKSHAGSAPAASGKDPHAPLKAAITKFRRAFDEWGDSTARTIEEALEQCDPNAIACFALLDTFRAIEPPEHYSVQSYFYSNEAPTKPKQPMEAGDAAVTLLKIAATGNIAELLKAIHEHVELDVLIPGHPGVMQAMAESIGARITMFPEWSEYEPAPPKAETTTTTKPRARKKKSAKKKTASKGK